MLKHGRKNKNRKRKSRKPGILIVLAAIWLSGQPGTYGLFSGSEVFAAQTGKTGIVMQAQERLFEDGILEIEDEHIYEDMKTAWSDGYEPEVKNGCAKLVLPLSVKDGAEVSYVSAALEFSETKDSPFVIRNYKKTVRQESILAQDGTVEELFFVCFDLNLSESRINGIYPVTVSVQYSCQGKKMVQDFLIYVRITDGKDAAANLTGQEKTDASDSLSEKTVSDGTGAVSADEPQEAVTYADSSSQSGADQEKASSEPKVILSGCSASAETLQAGGSITVNAVLKNTNAKKYVQNMTVTVAVQEPGISLEADSNVFYIERLGAGKTTELPLTFSVSEQTLAGKYPVLLELSYDNPEAAALTSSMQFLLNVSQTMDVGFDVGTYSDEMNAGDSISIPVQAINMGQDMIYNVRCELDVPGLEQKTILYLGNLDGGTAGQGELTAFAGMVNPLAENEEERYGATGGTLELIYEDAGGNEYRQSEDIRLTIHPLTISAHTEEEQDDAPKIGRQFLIGLILIGAAAAGLYFIPRRIKKKAGTVYDDK